MFTVQMYKDLIQAVHVDVSFFMNCGCSLLEFIVLHCQWSNKEIQEDIYLLPKMNSRIK